MANKDYGKPVHLFSGNKKKNISVRSLIETVNLRNRNSTVDPSIRKGWNDLLETVLHSTLNYCGFSYLYENEVPTGAKPGIRLLGKGYGPDELEFPDETRRAYYISRGL